MATKKTTTKKETVDETQDWRYAGLTLLSKLVEQTSGNIIGLAENKLNKVQRTISINAVSVALGVIGAGLMTIGLAIFVGNLLDNPSYGYLLIGGLSLVAAYLLNKK